MEYALETISKYIRDNQAKYGHYHSTTLIKALEKVKRNNMMKFWNEFGKQICRDGNGKISCTSLGYSIWRAPWAQMFPRWKDFLILLKRFTVDGFSIWLPPAELSDKEAAANWIEFQADLNNDNGLKWEFEAKSNSVVCIPVWLTGVLLRSHICNHRILSIFF